MCIIIDSCCFASVFEKRALDHSDFRPVLEWVVAGKGKIVYGGTKYRRELKRAKKYIFFIGELKRAGKTVELPSQIVDEIENETKQKISHRNFDDQHIVAMIIVSKCRLICTKDKRANPFIKEPSLYPKKFKVPKLYCSSRNANLLRDDYIIEICRPIKKGSKDLRQLFKLQ